VVIAVCCIKNGIVLSPKIPSINIIYKTISIIIDTINGVVRVNPHIRRQVWMSYLNTFIDDPNVDR